MIKASDLPQLNRLYFTIFFLTLVTFSFTIILEQVNSQESVTASLQAELPDPFERLTGKYIHPEAGLQINLPQGWSGFRERGLIDIGIVGPNIMNATDMGKQNVSMTLLVLDLPFMRNITSQINNNDTLPLPDAFEEIQESGGGGCNIVSQSYSNDTHISDVVRECNILGNYTKEKASIVATEQKLIFITLRANSSELYDSNFEKFNNSLASLQVNNTVDITKALADLYNTTAGAASSDNFTQSTSTQLINNNNNTVFERAKQQYLSAWNNTDFHSEFDTFITDPSSVLGYGKYQERKSNVFAKGENIVLYVEPVGFAYKEVYDQDGRRLYLMNFTANILAFDKQGKQIDAVTYDIPDIISQRKNTEQHLIVELSAGDQYPEGEYTLRYFIMDETSGRNFELEKNIRIVEEVVDI